MGTSLRTSIEAAAAAAREGATIPLVACGAIARGEELMLPEPDGAPPVFEIGSITKTMTATLLADMAGRGEVSLDDTIDRYFPEGVRAPSPGITLYHLATHASGLPRLPPNLREGDVDPANPYARFTMEMLWEAVGQTALERPVGSSSSYSNFGFGLLGQLLARAVGVAFDDLLAERVLLPLGMTETWRVIPPEAADRFADGHDEEGNPVPHWETPTLAGAGGLRSTVPDVMRYLRAQLDPASTSIATAIEATQQTREVVNERLSIGLAWHTSSTGGREILWHNGGTGGFGSFAAFDRRRGAACVLLANASHRNEQDLAGVRLLAALTAD